MPNKQLMTFKEFWEFLDKKGYLYGEDAADNAYVGYKLANEIKETAVVSILVKEIIRGIANDLDANGFNSVAAELRALIGE